MHCRSGCSSVVACSAAWGDAAARGEAPAVSCAAPGGVHTAARTPWGDNVEIIAEAPYLAASGRKCRQLQVMEPGGSVRAALACETPNGWAHQRLVTQAGGR